MTGLFGKLNNNAHKRPLAGNWAAFTKKYEPSSDLVTPPDRILQACKDGGFPNELLDFMKRYGFGNFGDGIIKLVNPEEYMVSLYTWLGRQDFSRIPFMMTGFGDIFYFRNLGNGEYDVAMLDVHYRKITVLAWSIDDFLAYLLQPETEEMVLRKSLFDSAKEKCGLLASDEIYFFAPALCLGGAENIKYVDKGNAAVHHDILFQLSPVS